MQLNLPGKHNVLNALAAIAIGIELDVDFDAMKRAWDAGIMIRITGDIIALSPPLIITEPEITTLCQTLGDVLSDLP